MLIGKITGGLHFNRPITDPSFLQQMGDGPGGNASG